MSFEKIAGPPKVISFYYLIDNLFDIDSLWSMYKAENKQNNEGETLLDELSITEDERDIFMQMLSDATTDVFNRFLEVHKRNYGCNRV